MGGGRIEVDVKFKPMLNDTAKDLFTFLRYVEGGGVIFALRIPTMDPEGAYDTNLTRTGEYYNLNRTNADNQLVQYLAPNVVSPTVRDGGSKTLLSRAAYPPTLKCSLKGQSQVIKYADDRTIRIDISVMERW